MKFIVRQYGATVIASFVGLILILYFCTGLIGDKNIMKIVEEMVCEQSSSVMSAGFDDSAFLEAVSSDFVEIQTNLEGKMYCGEKIYINNYLDIVSDNELAARLEIIKIIDKDGNDCQIPYDDDGYYLYFEEAGIYEIYVRIGLPKRDRYAKFKVIVNREMEG